VEYTLEAKNISKYYSGHVALEDVSISIPQNSIYGLLGPNGAGKTTLIRIINQIIDADKGTVFINGTQLNADHISVIGYLPEERGLYKQMKVGEQLVYLGRLRNMTKADAIAKSKAWTQRLEIHEWWNKKIEDLSKGMAQKIQFISTVLNEPKLIILDEPFSGFDPVNANLIKDEILRLRENGSTVIFSTHRMESVEELCDHIGLINKSKKILEGEKSAIKNAYRSNTFVVDHKGVWSNGHDPDFDVLGQTPLEENVYQSVIQIGAGSSPNKLLSKLIQETEVFGFVEKIPTINEIFISKVKEF
jgi:ABC-2 type transport system ATP-binding protein